MLTIKNFQKLFGKDVLTYRISRAVENETKYEIKLLKSNGHSLSVYIERDAIDNQYEIWVQKTMKAERLFFELDHFKTMDEFLGCLRVLIM
jgi:hypothetical protein